MCGVCPGGAACLGVAGAAGVRRASAVPGGGACLLCRLLTLPLAYFFAPIPQPPSRREGGDYRLFYARGCAPCIPGAEPTRHWFALPLWKTQWGGLPRRCRRGGRQRYPAGGVPALSPACPATAVPAGGVPALSPVNPAFNLLSCPHPPTPFPAGRGLTIGYFCKGLRPLHPRG